MHPDGNEFILIVRRQVIEWQNGQADRVAIVFPAVQSQAFCNDQGECHTQQSDDRRIDAAGPELSICPRSLDIGNHSRRYSVSSLGGAICIRN